MVHKSPLRLLLVGLVMVASPAAAAFVPYLWAPAIILVLTGCYLITWSTLGRGYWCRECKKFGLFPRGNTGVQHRATSDTDPSEKRKR
jgi:hypothetical protein